MKNLIFLIKNFDQFIKNYFEFEVEFRKKIIIALTNNKASMLNTPKEFSTRDLINKKII